MFNRKRRGDFDEDENYRDFRPRMPKRQRIPPVVQLCKEMMPDIRTIGESVKAFEDDIKFLSEAIMNEYGHEDYFNNALLSTLNAVVVEQPQKQAAIALLTMVVNSKNNVAGKSIINYFFEELQKWCKQTYNDEFKSTSNETGPWNKIKLILRFLSILSPMFLVDELINIYKSLFELSIELNNLDPGNRVPLSEAIYTNTLLNIPYLFFFNRNNDGLRTKVEELLAYVEQNYLVKTTDINLLREYNGEPPYEMVELVRVVLPNVKKALINNLEQLNELFPDWNHLLTPQTGDEGFNDALTLPSVDDLKSFVRLNKNFGSVDSMWKTPRYAFHVYLPNSAGNFETVVPISTYAGQLFNDIIIDLVESLEFNRKEVARQVITLDLFFKAGIFTEPGESIAQLIATYEENPLAPTFKIEDLAIETILGLIFKLPSVSQPFAYFYTLLVDICQNSPKAIAPVFGRAFRFFYSHLDSLDFELKLRYLDWFSIQMSNFNFSWKWNEWEDDSIKFGKYFYNPKVNFAKNLIQKELRLTSNFSEVEDSLPQEFTKYLDTSYIPRDQLINYYQSLFTGYTVEEDSVRKNDLYFRQEGVPMENTVRKILDYTHKANNSREVTELESILGELKNEYGSIISDFNRFVIILLVQAVTDSGSRSLSHANKYINDLKEDLKTIFAKIELDIETKEYIIIEAVLTFWNANPQTGFLVADAFKYAGLLTSRTIFTFIFNETGLKNNGLIEATAIEAVFRNLSQQISEENESGNNFEFVFERLCTIANSTIDLLDVNADEDIEIPKVNGEMDIDDIEDDKLDLKWKYFTVIGFIKSILRRYSHEYRELADKLIANIDNAIPHESTRRTISNWIQETKEV
ncbi:Nuclear cap-binding protein complex subunit 1 [Saccharomyces cerevisiae]|nr:Nuclear cap-binding protein complex subunit 1 [Saccharomyces cerevisiae]CAI4667160.1 BDN_1c_G0041400.mRNA.1.CDS.1 [Saccharomyces cerevisiae]CAI7253062.1 BDN_1c_G0041400.mRNA.1.CDS.1 [Saccharomyces cerevisiae]